MYSSVIAGPPPADGDFHQHVAHVRTDKKPSFPFIYRSGTEIQPMKTLIPRKR